MISWGTQGMSDESWGKTTPSIFTHFTVSSMSSTIPGTYLLLRFVAKNDVMSGPEIKLLMPLPLSGVSAHWSWQASSAYDAHLGILTNSACKVLTGYLRPVASGSRSNIWCEINRKDATSCQWYLPRIAPPSFGLLHISSNSASITQIFCKRTLYLITVE